ncbi:hypothetical protein L1049_000586 [Liquidambar formosana]|uniref:Uncharacterized protein n=1 Tax=Liquidambar formosana TaxID=63359 RepID=A0AAP0NAU5_LIQFO
MIQNQWGEQLNAKTDGNHSNIEVGAMPDFMAKTPLRKLPFLLPQDTRSRTSRDKLERTEVGKRLVTASNNLGISTSKQTPVISICRFKDGTLLGSNSSSLVRSLAFEINDSDD